ncbi:MAG: hypothetical protein N3A01_09890 [Bacteroidales bacterium]|nr:hypothetical protein [Bacteroidales bacterium]
MNKCVANARCTNLTFAKQRTILVFLNAQNPSTMAFARKLAKAKFQYNGR